MNEPATASAFPDHFFARYATLFKMFGILALIMILLIPLGMIKSVLWERASRRDQTIEDITATWGKEQILVGPVLIVPYRYSYKTWQEETVNGKVERKEVVASAISEAFFLPAELTIGGTIEPNKLYRGIYEAVVYSGNLKLSGHFTPPAFETLKIAARDVQWEDAVITWAITDLRGTRATLNLKWGEQSLPMTPGTALSMFSSGIQARIPGLQTAPGTLPFELQLTFQGSTGISVAPVGMQNIVKFTSPWPDPSFRGAFLPVERRVTPQGFDATWHVSYYGRDYPQQWTAQEKNVKFSAATVQHSLFGVAFLSVVDAYRNVERSIKYGIMFIALIFIAFFLFELLSALKIHPLQYLLIGAALCLFYLALLSLSEFSSFLWAYIAAAGAAIVLVTFYTFQVLKSGVRTGIITGELVAIYLFLYVILQMQDYSLLVGTAGLFLALAIMMYVTRNIDWYARDRRPTAS